METEATDLHYWQRTGNMEDDGTTLVFVYGTLKKGKSNHPGFMSTSERIGEAITWDKFLMYSVGFPLVRLPTEHEGGYYQGRVKGEVYRVNSDTLKRLDRLEGHPTFYERRITTIFGLLADAEVWMYHWAEKGGVVDGGARAPIGRTNDQKEQVHDWQF